STRPRAARATPGQPPSPASPATATTSGCSSPVDPERHPPTSRPPRQAPFDSNQDSASGRPSRPPRPALTRQANRPRPPTSPVVYRDWTVLARSPGCNSSVLRRLQSGQGDVNEPADRRG